VTQVNDFMRALAQQAASALAQQAVSALAQQAVSALAQQAVSGWRTRGAAARGVDPRADEPRDYGTGVTEVNDFMRAGEDDPRQPMVSRWGGLAVGRGRVPGCR